MKYEHTHASTRDGSPAMLVSQDAESITLVNEDGFKWTDPREQWEPIPPEPDFRLIYEATVRNIERMAREPGRVRTPSEIRRLDAGRAKGNG